MNTRCITRSGFAFLTACSIALAPVVASPLHALAESPQPNLFPGGGTGCHDAPSAENCDGVLWLQSQCQDARSRDVVAIYDPNDPRDPTGEVFLNADAYCKTMWANVQTSTGDNYQGTNVVAHIHRSGTYPNTTFGQDAATGRTDNNSYVDSPMLYCANPCAGIGIGAIGSGGNSTKEWPGF